MKRRTVFPVLFLLSVLPLAADELRWIDLPNAQFEMNGLPWYSENQNQLIRLPISLKDTYRKEVWELAQDPAGGRIRFNTNAKKLAIRLQWPEAPGSRNLHWYGQAGVDLYADGVYVQSAVPDKEPSGKPLERTFFDYSDKPRRDREIVIYLPIYMGVKVFAIGLDAEARIRPAKPFALSKPVVFYGTSITQGGCASRPGMSYQAILGRMLNLDHVNLGFSGNGKGEPALAEAVASIDASCYVMDFAQNNETADSLKAVYAPFLATIRAKHPNTPIVTVTPIYASHEVMPGGDARLDGMRIVIRRAAGDRIAAGDGNITIVEGTDLLGPADGDGLVDGTHPNDLGFQGMAMGLANRLRKVLGL